MESTGTLVPGSSGLNTQAIAFCFMVGLSALNVSSFEQTLSDSAIRQSQIFQGKRNHSF
jgi:hypothetical protein